jgi:hypothetical protein
VALTALQLDAAKTDTNFVARVEFYMAKAALAIINEGNADPNHANRAELGREILLEPQKFASRFALAAATQPAITTATSLAAVSDTDLEGAVNSVYPSFVKPLTG